jgi:peroxiredoxin Q/BCP
VLYPFKISLALVLALTQISCSQSDTTMAKLNVGDVAPNFELNDANNNIVKLSDYRGKKNVVVYFYPKDDTPGCTAQACSFRDNYEDFAGVGAEVIGISSDGAVSHQGFAGKYELPFVLLSDPKGEARKAYDAYDLFGMIPGRVTFVINMEGKVIHKFDSQLSPTKHIKEALNILSAQ